LGARRVLEVKGLSGSLEKGPDRVEKEGGGKFKVHKRQGLKRGCLGGFTWALAQWTFDHSPQIVWDRGEIAELGKGGARITDSGLMQTGRGNLGRPWFRKLGYAVYLKERARKKGERLRFDWLAIWGIHGNKAGETEQKARLKIGNAPKKVDARICMRHSSPYSNSGRSLGFLPGG